MVNWFEIGYGFIFGGLLAGLIGFGGGYLMHPANRAVLMRQLSGKDYGLVCVVSKSGKKIRTYIINLEEDKIAINGRIWVASKGYICDQSDVNRGFFFKKVKPVEQWGLPSVYVDFDNCRPIELKAEKTAPLPDELGTWFIAQSRINVLKGIKWMEEHKTLTFVGLGLTFLAVILAAFAAFSAMDASTNAQACVAGVGEVKGLIEYVCGASYVNGTIVVK